MQIYIQQCTQKLFDFSGKLRMGLIRKAEKETHAKAQKHVKYRKKDWYVAAFCISAIVSIYGYTIWAMRQETFLDDFEVPRHVEIRS